MRLRVEAEGKDCEGEGCRMRATLGKPGKAAAQLVGQASSSANHGARQAGQPEWQCSPSATV